MSFISSSESFKVPEEKASQIMFVKLLFLMFIEEFMQGETILDSFMQILWMKQ